MFVIRLNGNLYLLWKSKFWHVSPDQNSEWIISLSSHPAAVNRLKIQHQEDPNSTTLAANKSVLLRSLFTVGTLARHFDFDLEEFKGTSKVGLLSNF